MYIISEISPRTISVLPPPQFGSAMFQRKTYDCTENNRVFVNFYIKLTKNWRRKKKLNSGTKAAYNTPNLTSAENAVEKRVTS